MPDPPQTAPAPNCGPAKTGQYTVLARRYRPQRFEELVGQEHIARALSNAISTQRIGHAYLFTGGRGIGKTSAARILAKALNCVTGPTPVPCNQCDVCARISAGDDIDVLEIDGASNRGIDEIRQLRQNVSVRPSRERFKVYIIDEVHMLTREAFNALLKTLEEPPEHAKFILCTTEPAKVPVTIVSRCQRFDFAGIDARAIAQRLQQIVQAEGVSAEPEALEILARRAGGSMRDSQSLLEQLLAFAPGRITVADVHQMFGTAGEEQLTRLLGHLADRNAAGVLAELDSAAQAGIDLGQFLEQILGCLRDCMVAAAGAPEDLLLYASSGNREKVVELGKRIGLDTLLAATQIIDQTLARLRFSSQPRLLVELALVRICQLEELVELPSLIASLRAVSASETVGAVEQPPVGAGAGASPVKKNGAAEPPPPAVPEPGRPSGRLTLRPDNATEVWLRAVGQVPGLAADNAKQFHHVASPAPNHLVVCFKPGYTVCKSVCERPEQKARFEEALAELTGGPVRLEFEVFSEDESPAGPAGVAKPASPRERLAQAAEHPMICRAIELFGAEPVRVDQPAEEP
ncbi:MAG: DNA polymerase III subunit gamma/tau [Thermoguttaceae bacterium]